MKIVDPVNIKVGEQELIDTIREKIDLQAIEGVVTRQVSLKNLEFNEGDIVIHEGSVAYRLDFTVQMGVSILFDREGTLLSSAPVEQAGIGGEEETMTVEASSEDELSSMVDGDLVESEAAPVSEIEALLGKNRDYWKGKVEENKV